MAEVQFYHLLTTPLERALPKLMEKALESGMRGVVRVDSETLMHQLNDALWTYDDHSFLPHGIMDSPHAADQPIHITCRDENPNGAKVLVITDGSVVAQPNAYAKILDMFDGHDPTSVANARSRWKHYQNANLSVTYIKQQTGGGWKKMAGGTTS